MRIVVYTGTSLSHHDAKKILEADYRPPVRRHDLTRIMKSSPDIIGIIDGIFFDSAAVAHREIIEAINSGITVVGGGSMGALRASELFSFGMIGVGRIYEMYSRGELESDDEVAVTFDPESMEPLSIPLVNIRFTLKRMQGSGTITEDQALAILDITRRLFYPDRNYQNIVLESVRKGLIREEEKEKLLGSLKMHEVDVKREDAVSVLNNIKNIHRH
ncbi:MAG: TfuA-related McrA-glycine thioamidation protein [Candidatus Methanoperedens sp.]|nr:TfuA-related McrA-glycine thioamidation protein [Candidatus Methanoperedens sp.]MCE8425099.1 TfuA-related McrA-glycine thioamidation protein [Candidatus Methanoperedens sp.]MCE8427755.1 TfuA-related McrA-glycine thioamidation protein [Candidatus Methanoperedens sp.]